MLGVIGLVLYWLSLAGLLFCFLTFCKEERQEIGDYKGNFPLCRKGGNSERSERHRGIVPPLENCESNFFLPFPGFRSLRQLVVKLLFSGHSSKPSSTRRLSREQLLEMARSGKCLHGGSECSASARAIFQSCQRCWVKHKLDKG